jgi:hypothetical protein
MGMGDGEKVVGRAAVFLWLKFHDVSDFRTDGQTPAGIPEFDRRVRTKSLAVHQCSTGLERSSRRKLGLEAKSLASMTVLRCSRQVRILCTTQI